MYSYRSTSVYLYKAYVCSLIEVLVFIFTRPFSTCSLIEVLVFIFTRHIYVVL